MYNVSSLVLNPSSVHHDKIHAAVSAAYESPYFPRDVDTLLVNCRNIAWRVARCNENTLPIVDLLQKHPLVAQVNHPSIGPTAPLYKCLMRKDGGYGDVLSIIFHDPTRAEYFYNVLDVCKGSSFGTNFTLAIPYVQLANYWQRDKVPKYGVPQHII
jgi:cystathionine gamma-synthase